MNLNECRQLLQKTLFGNLPKHIQMQLSVSDMMVEQLSKQIVAANVPYENVEWMLIPRLKTTIFRIYNAGKFFHFPSFKRQIAKMISEDNLHVPVPIAVKKSKNESVMQRRIDSLSRILSVHSRVSNCTAVALIKGRLFVATNTPSCRAEFQQQIETKLGILRKFLKQITPTDLVLGEQDAIKFTNRGDLAAFEIADELIDSGSGVIASENYSREERLKIDIIKIACSYLEGLGTQGRKGFNLIQIKGLLYANPIFQFPKAEVEAKTGLAVHAEQLLFLQVKALKDQGRISGTDLPVNLGISKLAFRACESVLDEGLALVTYRGASDIGFAKVADVRTGREHKPRNTIGPKTNFIPVDSDSDTSMRPDDSMRNHSEAPNKSPRYYSVFKAPERAEREVISSSLIKLKS